MYVHYFARENKQGHPVLRDGTIILPAARHHAEGKIVLCENGFHGSVSALDALKYADGHWYCPRRLFGDIVEDVDKVAASDAVTLAVVNAHDALHEFACREAELALTTAGVTDERCWAAIAAKRAWLRGEISDEKMAAAGSAAWDATRDASLSATRDAARVAAWDAACAAGEARDAAWAASCAAGEARVAAWAASWIATRPTAWDVAKVAAWAAGEAAWVVARVAAWAAGEAAWVASNERLEAILAELIEGAAHGETSG